MAAEVEFGILEVLSGRGSAPPPQRRDEPSWVPSPYHRQDLQAPWLAYPWLKR